MPQESFLPFFLAGFDVEASADIYIDIDVCVCIYI